jgi:cell division septal protein FtsQ
MKKKILLCSVAVLFSFLFLAGTVVAQGSAAKKEIQKVTMKGKIHYNEQSKVYSVVSENPPTQVFIVNPNKKVLDKLKLSGKTVTIEGHFTIGADHLMIDKLNGKKY